MPGVSFFIPGKWYNVVALLDGDGIRFYCNVASPPYLNKKNHAVTYIDYDLDVIRTAEGEILVVDQDEYDTHKKRYHYSDVVQAKVQNGLEGLPYARVNKSRPSRNMLYCTIIMNGNR